MWAEKPLSFVRRKTNRGEDQRTLLSEIWEANDRAALNYVPKPYPGRVAIFLPFKEYAHHLRPGLAIEPLITGAIDKCRFPAYPAGMMVEPFVQKLAAKVTEYIDQALLPPSR